ncbi:hypothetical protein I603_2503 [Erythrobacter dokdonensis DSW-74]|uniref:Uncharacterized protein n=1 Tax=Erythrobacter dokdonensis DSW-74 TaxID=1300349 RepID=A0A1A7BG41_9SPHN|nr:hypothetical protein I603_2503 [Erythrobacter dokdonensis DSW-74]
MRHDLVPVWLASILHRNCGQARFGYIPIGCHVPDSAVTRCIDGTGKTGCPDNSNPNFSMIVRTACRTGAGAAWSARNGQQGLSHQ